MTETAGLGKTIELVKTIVKALVEHPEEVHVTVTEPLQEREVRFRLKVHPEDIRHVIGRRGRTIQALRTVVAAAIASPGRRIHLEVHQHEGVEE